MSFGFENGIPVHRKRKKMGKDYQVKGPLKNSGPKLGEELQR
jgi:hypothetical protein